VSVWAGTTGRLDEVPVEDIRRFDAEFSDFISRDKPAIFDTIRTTTDLNDDTVSELDAAMKTFKRQFTTSSGDMLVKDEPVAALDEEEIDPTQITVKKRA